MKIVFLTSLIIVGGAVHADWTQVQCVPDYQRMENHRGMIVSPEGCDQKICEVSAICTNVDSDILKAFGTPQKIPPTVMARNSFVGGKSGFCKTDAGNCPDFSVCMGDNDHNVAKKWDATMPNMAPYIYIPPEFAEPVPAVPDAKADPTPDAKPDAKPDGATR
jgi:hypothetical protein